MPTTSGTRKKASKKKTAKKVSTKAVTKKKASKKAAKKTSSKKTTSPSPQSLSPEQRHAMICEAAYYIAEQRGFDTGNDMDDWLAAESLIDSQFGD